LLVFNGELYAATVGDPNYGWYKPYLMKYNGFDAWVKILTSNLGSQCYGIGSLVEFEGAIYGGGMGYGGDAGGRLFMYNPQSAPYWVDKAPRYSSEQVISALAVFNNKIYGGSAFNGYLFEWNGSNGWLLRAPHIANVNRINCLTVFEGELYAGTGDTCQLLKWNGSNAWIALAGQYGSEQVISALVIYKEKLYGCTRVWGTPSGGYLLEWNGSVWVEKASAGVGLTSMVVCGGYLYASGTNGKLYRWNDVDAWDQVADQLDSDLGKILAVF
jgi:hypothetical protein